MERWEGRTGPAWARTLSIPSVEIYRSLPSTNDRGKAVGRERPARDLPALILADEQTQGRGRSGRGWSSPSGSGVWMSMVLPGADPHVDALLPLRVGIAAARRLEPLLGRPLELKWPNDLILSEASERKKVGGILCERALSGDGGAGSAFVVVGMGVNVFPVDADGAPATWLAAQGFGTPGEEREQVLQALVECALDARAIQESRLTHGEQEEWARRDILQGQMITWEGPAAGQGTATGVDALGRLLVRTPAGEEALGAGVVQLRRASVTEES